jgi:hypothetical protein
VYFEDYNLSLTQKLGKRGRFVKVSSLHLIEPLMETFILANQMGMEIYRQKACATPFSLNIFFNPFRIFYEII